MAQERDRQAMRPTAVERGYDRHWQQLRAAHLAEHPACSVEGCGRPATDVDHIEAIADAPERRLDPTNLRSLCKQHHSQRTARDQSFANAPQRGMRHPDWLKRSIVPLTVVCGPAASGKATFVAKRAGPRDMVLDMPGIVAKLSGFPRYEAPLAWQDAALRWRNSRLQLLSMVSRRWPCAWLMLAEPQARWRDWWRDHVGAVRVLVIETPIDECLRRLVLDERRSPMVQARHAELVQRWWQTYERCERDMVMLPDGRVTTGRGLMPRPA